MARLSIVLSVVMLSVSPAAAEDRTWEAVFVSSASVGMLGGALFWYGSNQIVHAEEQLCTGRYVSDCGHPPPDTQAEIDRLNERGDRGVVFARVGAAAILAGGGLAIYAGYKGFIAKKEDRPAAVVFAPSITPQGAGAWLQLRW